MNEINNIFYICSNTTNKNVEKMKNQNQILSITTAEFHEYLIHLGLSRWIIEQKNGNFEAVLKSTSKPKISDFSRVYKNDDGLDVVFLSKNDIHNKSITKGFFE